MKHKTKQKSVFTLPSELTFWQRTDFSFIKRYITPVLFLLTAGVMIVLAQWAVLSRKGDSFAIGEPSPETFRVITHMRYDDPYSSNRLRGMVSENIVGVTVKDVSAKTRLLHRIEALSDIYAPSTKAYLSVYSGGLLSAISNLKAEDRERILNISYQAGISVIDRLDAEKVHRTDNAQITSILWDEINKLNPSQEDSNFVYQILSPLGNPNYRVNDELTRLARRAAMDDVPTLNRRLEPGDVIVLRGEIVTKETAYYLRKQGYTEDVFPFEQLVIVFVAVLVLPLWLEILSKGVGEHKPTWWCTAFIILTAWCWEALAERLGIHGAGVIPAATVAFLAMPGYTGFCLTMIAAGSGVFVITGLAVSNFILLSIMAIAASTLGFYFFRNLESRMKVYKHIAMLSFEMTVIRMIMRYFQGAVFTQDSFRLFIPLGEFWQEAGMYFLFEMLAAHVMTFVLQYVEEAIGTLSILSLREISHPSSPLLHDMQRYAPGTYQHCQTIATLIEAVGIELGMDANLLRAGAYYHDIGKLRKPLYFVENQGGGLNLNDEMSPMLSSIAIRSHVKDGLELAWEAKLPKRIQDFIAEHHGTTCTFYFYKKALAQGEKVEKADFAYPGPKPQSRETALLMIVDSVEAAVRAANIRDVAGSKEQTASAIEKIINQVIASKLNENQFDEVNLTQKDLTVIKKTLVSVLASMYHTRKVKKIDGRKS